MSQKSHKMIVFCYRIVPQESWSSAIFSLVYHGIKAQSDEANFLRIKSKVSGSWWYFSGFSRTNCILIFPTFGELAYSRCDVIPFVQWGRRAPVLLSVLREIYLSLTAGKVETRKWFFQVNFPGFSIEEKVWEFIFKTVFQ